MADDPPVLEIVLTGTGTPVPVPGRAGPGVLVRCGDVELQFDCGRGTGMRLSQLRTGPTRLTGVFITHHHSDHLVDLADLAMTRWIMRNDTPLPVVAPEGPSAEFARHVLDVWADELELRREHTHRSTVPSIEVTAFDPPEAPAVIWSSGDVRVSATAVRHEPVRPAVAYRVDAPAGSVVISGDTRVCAEVEALAEGADVLVHEVCRIREVQGTPFAFALNYHADSLELGAMAARLSVPTLVLTHLIPPPMAPALVEGYAQDMRDGGFTGTVVVGEDLARVTLP